MKKILLSVTSVFLCISLMAQNSTNLKLNLEKNKIYRFRSSSEETISQTINGVQQNTSVKVNSVTSIKMVDATADFMIAEIRFDTIINSTNAMGKLTTVNSDSAGNLKSQDIGDVLSCIMNRLSKNPLFVKMDYTGKIIDIVNEKMLSGIITKDTASITGQMATMIKSQIKNLTSDKALRTMVEVYTRNLPDKAVTPGDKWDVILATNSGGMSLDLATTYILNDIKDNIADISTETNIKASVNADPMNYGPAKITYDNITGLGKSTMTMDILTGLVIENKAKTHIAGNLAVNYPGGSTQVPMEIDMESNVVAIQ